VFAAGPLNGLLGTPNEYTWSPDNSAEVDRGWIRSAGSPAELAAKTGLDPAVLTQTLEEYNAAAGAVSLGLGARDRARWRAD
jgi:hypothetical protein